MPKTVNSAFRDFLDDEVNLDPDQSKRARNSRDYLITNIAEFGKATDFFDLYSGFNLYYGSFARKTKKRPLDDIDLMVGLSGRGYSYQQEGDHYLISVNDRDKEYGCTDDDGYLNSRKVIELLKGRLYQISNYQKAEMHRNMQAITLQLSSYTWNFDIVPCFYTDAGFYLIPNGYGKWEKTDPRIDNKRTTRINQKFDGHLLELIRLVKYLNSRKLTVTIPSYLLEVIILNYYDRQYFNGNWEIDDNLKLVFGEIATEILGSVMDPKGIQGNINTLEGEDRLKISTFFDKIAKEAGNAVLQRIIGNEQAAIEIWSSIFGEQFKK
ncbi:SMODS domain-containing nucleotidyltransferase [Lactobacillus amylovorus]|uniref:SMODS domain-containing nucleotidyltransferase n=1 Tax=Lactobacillus amylovorus TaxID=1604 RepID=UPI0021A801C8|nr:hypothetical protein [Lactobacillus amylovorus]MCT3601223.1 nucleotidyltransferase [Lactobacillus amylovorus]